MSEIVNTQINKIYWKDDVFMESNKEKNVKVREKIGSVVTCKHCGKEFTKQFANEQYCSAECKLEMTRYHWRKRSLKYKAKKKLEKQQLEQQMAQNATVDTTDTTDRSDN